MVLDLEDMLRRCPRNGELKDYDDDNNNDDDDDDDDDDVNIIWMMM